VLGRTAREREVHNPKAIVTSSPRLDWNAYLGFALGNGNNAIGVVADVMRESFGDRGSL